MAKDTGYKTLLRQSKYNFLKWGEYMKRANLAERELEELKNNKPIYCCRLDQEFICGIVRNRSGISSGELDYAIRTERTECDIDNVIIEVNRLLKRLNENKERLAELSKTEVKEG